MKKHFVLGLCLMLLGWTGLTQAQTYPIKAYGLVTNQTAPERPADGVENGWTYFKLPAVAEGKKDTLTTLYLSSQADPVNLSSQQEVVLAESFGFEFEFGGRKMTHFGLSARGVLYVGAPAEGQTEVKRNINYVPHLNGSTDLIAALPHGGSNARDVAQLAADKSTKIGYCKGSAGTPAVNYVMISFRDVLADFTAQTVPYSVRMSYDVILYEDGRVQLRPDQIDYPAASAPVLYFAYGLQGEQGDGIYATNWQGASKASAQIAPMAVTADSNATATVLTYDLPPVCEKPADLAFDVAVSACYSTDFTAKLTKKAEGICDGWLVLVADRADMTEKPVDGKTYRAMKGVIAGDSIGGFPVRLVGNAAVNLTVTGLEAEKTYYIYVYPYNDMCRQAPKYQAAPFVYALTMKKGAPAVETAETTGTSVTFNLSDLAAEARVLVGVAERDYRSTSTRYELPSPGISGREQAWTKGDTLFQDLSTKVSNNNHGPYVITVAYEGAVTDGKLKIEGLHPGKPYYFYFWKALEDQNQYTEEYREVGVYTLAATPHTFTLATDRVPNAKEIYRPAGWSASQEGMNADWLAGVYKMAGEEAVDVDDLRALAVSLTRNDGADVTADAITPVFQATHTALDVRYRVRKQSGTGNSAQTLSLAEGDSLTVWYRTADASEWTLAEVVTSETAFPYGADRYAALKTTIDRVPVGQNLQLRFMIKATPAAQQYFLLHQVLVEPHLRCAYPENLTVFDSLTTHRALGFSWENANTSDVTVQFRHREAGADVWSAWQAAQKPTFGFIPRLNSHTAYEVAYRSVCRNDSSLVKTIQASTLRSLPYRQTLTDSTVWPADFGAWTGLLPEDETEAVALTRDVQKTYFVPGKSQLHGHAYAGTKFSVPATTNAWLTLPALCLENDPAPARYTFRYMAFSNKGGVTAPVNPESPFNVMVLVSRDGQFTRADSVGEITVQNLTDTLFQTYTIDLSAYTRQVHVALCVKQGDTKSADKNNYSFLIDSIAAHYTGDIPCYPVEDIRQSGLTANGVTISWWGSAYEYCIIYTNEDKGVKDTVYTFETSYTFDHLEPNTFYTYCVLGYCDDGHRSPGALSEERSFTTFDVCAVPADFAILRTTWQSVQMTCRSSREREIHIWAQDEAYRAEGIDYTFAWPLEKTDTVIVGTLFDRFNIPYYVAVRTVCGFNEYSGWTDTLAFTTDIPVCGAPSAFKVDGVGADYAELSWKAGAANDSYRLMYRAAQNRVFDTLRSSKTTYRLVNLNAETAYVCQLQAVCDRYLISPEVSVDFTTLDAGTPVEEEAYFAGLRVGSKNGRIVIWNAGALPIDRVEVYALTGRRLYAYDFHTIDHIFLPVLEGASIVLVRVFSGQDAAVYKVVLK